MLRWQNNVYWKSLVPLLIDESHYFSQEFWWWVPKLIYKQRTKHKRPTRGVSCILQFTRCHIWADFSHLCIAKTICCLFHTGAAILPDRFFREDGGGGWCGYSLYHGKDSFKYSQVEGRTHKSGHLWHPCVAGMSLFLDLHMAMGCAFFQPNAISIVALIVCICCRLAFLKKERKNTIKHRGITDIGQQIAGIHIRRMRKWKELGAWSSYLRSLEEVAYRYNAYNSRISITQ